MFLPQGVGEVKLLLGNILVDRFRVCYGVGRDGISYARLKAFRIVPRSFWIFSCKRVIA